MVQRKSSTTSHAPTYIFDSGRGALRREEELDPGSWSGRRGVRLDKWLWAARFYKTRTLAARAIAGGKVEVSGERAKRSKVLQVGDQVRVRQGPFEFRVVVHQLSEHRGRASDAAMLYQESGASRQARETLAAQLRLAKVPKFEGKGRPTKRDRRRLERLRESEK